MPCIGDEEVSPAFHLNEGEVTWTQLQTLLFSVKSEDPAIQVSA